MSLATQILDSQTPQQPSFPAFPSLRLFSTSFTINSLFSDIWIPSHVFHSTQKLFQKLQIAPYFVVKSIHSGEYIVVNLRGSTEQAFNTAFRGQQNTNIHSSSGEEGFSQDACVLSKLAYVALFGSTKYSSHSNQPSEYRSDFIPDFLNFSSVSPASIFKPNTSLEILAYLPKCSPKIAQIVHLESPQVPTASVSARGGGSNVTTVARYYRHLFQDLAPALLYGSVLCPGTQVALDWSHDVWISKVVLCSDTNEVPESRDYVQVALIENSHDDDDQFQSGTFELFQIQESTQIIFHDTWAPMERRRSTVTHTVHSDSSSQLPDYNYINAGNGLFFTTPLLSKLQNYIARTHRRLLHHPFLIIGTSGVGKTSLVREALNDNILSADHERHSISRNPVFWVTANDIVTRAYAGESEVFLLRLFGTAIDIAPCTVVIDDLNRLNHEYPGVVAILIDQLDWLYSQRRTSTGVTFIGIASSVGISGSEASLRLNRQLLLKLKNCNCQIEELHLPNAHERKQIASVFIDRCNIVMSDAKDESRDNTIYSRDRSTLSTWVARKTAGYTYADFHRLFGETVSLSFNKGTHDRKTTRITEESLKLVLLNSRPSMLASCIWWSPLNQSTTPNGKSSKKDNVDDNDKDATQHRIYGTEDAEKEIRKLIETAFSPFFQSLDLGSSRGVLVTGPSGCGKTSLVRKVATSGETNVVYVECARIINSRLGETERAIKSLFDFAKIISPTIMIVENIEILAPRRKKYGTDGPSDDGGGDSTSSGLFERALSTILMELDGVSTERQTLVFIIATTSSQDDIDPALLRPGRIEDLIQLDYPDDSSRRRILMDRLRIKNTDCECRISDVEIDRLVDRSRGFSGAEVSALCREILMENLRELLNKEATIDIDLRIDEYVLKRFSKNMLRFPQAL